MFGGSKSERRAAAAKAPKPKRLRAAAKAVGRAVGPAGRAAGREAAHVVKRNIPFVGGHRKAYRQSTRFRRLGVRAPLLGVLGAAFSAAHLQGTGQRHLRKHAAGLTKRGFDVKIKSNAPKGQVDIGITKTKNVPFSRAQPLTATEKAMRKRKRGY
jgi:hypothetical protein